MWYDTCSKFSPKKLLTQYHKKKSMDRRKALMNLGILTGGMMLLPSCEFSKEKISLALNNLQVNKMQESMLKDIVNSLIPEGDLSGAGSLNIDDFVWVMVDDCLDEASQKSYIRGLNNFDAQIKNMAKKPFNLLSSQEQIQAFKTITEDSKDQTLKLDNDVKVFLNTTKRFTILGYMKSAYIMTQIMPYSLVPTKYGTCETIDKTKRINVNG